VAHNITHLTGFEMKENHYGGSLTVEETRVSYGRVSCKVAVSGSTYTVMSLGAGQYWASFHLYIETLPGSGQDYYLQRQFSGIWRGSCWINDDGKLSVYRESGGTTTSTGALQTGKWYVITIRRGSSANPKIIARERDSGLIVAEAEVAALDDGCDNLYLGPVITSYGTCYWDNIVIESGGWASTDDPVTLLGTKYAIGLLVPTENATYTGYSGGYADVDEVPRDNDTTKIEMSGATGRETFRLQPCSSLATPVESIAAVRSFTFWEGLWGNNAWGQTMRIGGADYDYNAANRGTTGGSYVLEHTVHRNSPATSNPFLKSEIDALELGVYKYVGSNTEKHTTLQLELLYKVSAGRARAAQVI